MSNSSLPPSLPPQGPADVPNPPPPPPLGSDPTEHSPIQGGFGAIEAILRQPRRILFHLKNAAGGGLLGWLMLTALAASGIYGVVVGTFSGGTQLWAAPAKISAGLLLSAIICLPSLYIFACLGGSRARLVEVCGLVAGLLALMTILLTGFAPVAWLFSQ